MTSLRSSFTASARRSDQRHCLMSGLTQPLRFTAPFPWTPRHRERKHCQWQYKTKRERCLSKLNSFSFSFCTCGAACALSALVIPAGWSVSAPDAHRRHFFRLTLHSLIQFSTLKFWTQILLIFSVTLPLILAARF